MPLPNLFRAVLLAAALFSCSAAAEDTLPVVTFVPNPDGGSDKAFGRAVAMGGTLLAVSAPIRNAAGVSDAGSIYVFDLASGTPVFRALIDNPEPGVDDEFGHSLAVSGSRIVVGVPLDNVSGTDSGRVYVYDMNRTTPTEPEFVLRNPNPEIGDAFGWSVAIDGTRVVVGAYLDDEGATEDAGSIYVFDLTAANPPASSVRIKNPSPSTDERFGCSVGISGNLVAAGAYRQNGEDGEEDAGRAYVFDLASPTPTSFAYVLHNPDETENDDFAYSLAISGTRIVVGCDNDDNDGNLSGRAYVFDVGSGAAVLAATLRNPYPDDSDQFGGVVAISGGRVVVGASRDDSTDAGVAYVFDLDGPTPETVAATLRNPAPATGDRFGFSVAISGSRVVAGAPFDTTGGANSGETYFFAPRAPTATPLTPSPINFTSAVLRTSVSAGGAEATVVFEYGADTNYGSTVTPAALPVRGSDPRTLTAVATGLLPGREYHFRAIATNSEGTTISGTLSFITNANPPTVVTGNADQITSAGARLIGSVNANQAPTEYYFQYGLTTSYSASTAVSAAGAGDMPVDFLVPIGNLLANTQYNYRLVAKNLKHTVFGQNKTFTTLANGGGVTPPTVATGAASAIEQTEATVAGTVNPNGAVTTALFRYAPVGSLGAGSPAVEVTPAPGSGTMNVNVSARLTGLTAGTMYDFRVEATNPGGTTVGTAGSFTTPIQPIATTADAYVVEVNGGIYNLKPLENDLGTGRFLHTLAGPAFDEGRAVRSANQQEIVFTAHPASGATETFTYVAKDSADTESPATTITVRYFVNVQGTYYQTAPSVSGELFRIRLDTDFAGFATGRFEWQEEQYPFKGRFDENGVLTIEKARAGDDIASLAVNLKLNAAAPNMDCAFRDTGAAPDTATTTLAYFAADPDARPTPGLQVVFIDPGETGVAAAVSPNGVKLGALAEGIGFSLVRVGKGRTRPARFTTVMPDYGTFGANAPLAAGSGGVLPFYKLEKSYKRRGEDQGEVVGTATAGRSQRGPDRIFGALDWRSGGRTGLLAQLEGFRFRFGVGGVPVGFERDLTPNARVRIARGGLTAPIEFLVRLKNSQGTMATSETDPLVTGLGLVLKFKLTQGTFSGSFVMPKDPNSELVEDEKVSFKGGLAGELGFAEQLDRPEPRCRGSFFVKSTGRTGRIEITPLRP